MKRAWTERWSRAHDACVASVRIESTALVLTRDGVVDAETEVTHRFDPFSGDEWGEGE